MKDKKDIIIVVLAILIVITLIGYFLVGREKQEDFEYKKYNVIDITNCVKKNCNENYKFNNNIINITHDEDGHYQLRVNDKLALTDDVGPELYSKIYTFDNNMIISMYNENVGSYISYVYNIDKNELSVIDILSDSDDPRWYCNNIEVKDNVITFEESILYSNDEYEDIALRKSVKINNCETYKKYKDIPVKRVYESKYDNNSFSTPTLKEEVLLKNYKNYSSLCN